MYFFWQTLSTSARSTLLLEKLVVAQVFIMIPSFHENRRFITFSTKSSPFILSWVVWINFTFSHIISLGCNLTALSRPFPYLLRFRFIFRFSIPNSVSFSAVPCVGYDFKDNTKKWHNWITHESGSDEERQFSSHFPQNWQAWYCGKAL